MIKVGMLFISIKHEPKFKLFLSYRKVICLLVFKVQWQKDNLSFSIQSEMAEFWRDTSALECKIHRVKPSISVTFSGEIFNNNLTHL